MKRRQKPIIMTATMGASDFAWANALRQKHFPAERNLLSAHITLFHHLSPQGLDEIVGMVKETTVNCPNPATEIVEILHLGKGVAYKIHAPDLMEMRQFFAESLHGLLTVQDQQTPRLHITVQNKVSEKKSKALFEELSGAFQPRPFEINGLALHYYMDGPWEKIGDWRFRGKR